jgi:putative methyltransferase (TIGR04325 family)
MEAKSLLRSMVPPVLWHIGKACKSTLLGSPDHYAYAPGGWDTPLPDGARSEDYWTAFIAQGSAACQDAMARVKNRQPALRDSEYEFKHVVFAYALALSSHEKERTTVLDYGGSLGDYLWHGKALVPGIDLEYHCKELPAIAAAGRQVNPEVIWHTDDTCLLQSYDLIMFSSSLEYVRDWKQVVGSAAHVARRYLFLSDVPTVRHVPAFVGTERRGNVTNLHWQLNGRELVETVEATGLRLVREFPMGPYPRVALAPEQPTSVGWLFRR